MDPVHTPVLLDALGIRIVLNEQIAFNDGTTASLEVNAIRITIDSPLQLVAADVVIGHSFSTMTVPAPGAAGLLSAAGLLGSRRRRTARGR
ncbi:MAG: choice-of-anchor P family protein [Phycisphaerales bacterium]|nr:choice-of-anchor P family protein [Phycisphaerales bacterium]